MRGKKSSILQAFFKIVCIQFAQQNCRVRVDVNATHVKKKQFSKTVIELYALILSIFDRMTGN
jgi:hypothetical protein